MLFCWRWILYRLRDTFTVHPDSYEHSYENCVGGVFTATTTTTFSTTATFSSNQGCPTVGGVATTCANNQPNNAGSSASCPNCSTREAAIGAGIGIPLSAALLCSLILLFWRGKRDKENHPPAAVPPAMIPPTTPKPTMIQPYPAAPQSATVSNAYASGGSQDQQYLNQQREYAAYTQVRPRSDPVDPQFGEGPIQNHNQNIPLRVVSTGSDHGRYEVGDYVGRGEPPTYHPRTDLS